MNRGRLGTLGGIAGPAAFIAAWSALGAAKPGYSPIQEPISRLAAVGASTRPAMTAGFLAFGVGVGCYSPTLGRLSPSAVAAAAVTATATVAIAALPLGGPKGDTAHAVAAGTAYANLAALPLCAAGPLRRRGHSAAALLSAATGVGVAALLAASAVLPRGVGLAQRAGLTLGDAWIMVSALALSHRRRFSSGAGATAAS